MRTIKLQINTKDHKYPILIGSGLITKLSKSAIVESANQFGIGKVIRYWPASNGIENTNYFIETENNSEYVLTLIETGFEPSESMLTF